MPEDDVEVGSLIKRSFVWLWKDPGFIGLYLLPIPVMIVFMFHLFTIVEKFGLINPTAANAPPWGLIMDFIGWIILYVVIMGVLQLIGFSGVIVKAKGRKNGKKISFLKSLREGLGYVPRIIVIMIVTMLVVVGPFLLLPLGVFVMGAFFALLAVVLVFVWFIPAIYLGIRLSLSAQACVVEDIGPIDSLKGSWGATKGYVLTVFAVFLIFMLISAALSVIPRVLGGILGGTVVLAVVNSVGSFIVSFIVGPALVITLTLLFLEISE